YLSALLGRVALALEDLGQMIVEVETIILDDLQAERPDDLVRLPIQHLDHALQTIAELGQLMQRLSEQEMQIDQFSLTDMISPIRLERLRHLLANGRLTDERQSHKSVNSGHVSLF
ncbi:hypothetical protein, partial [Yoonia sp.]|uniref:hypothetical protein n=1 Tax=Yoonia sp. TaxID=2212373 RepID=UPI0019E03CF4